MAEGWSLALHNWTFFPSVVIGCTLIIAGYMAAIGPLRWRFPGSQPPRSSQTATFVLGVGVIFLTLVSPLDWLSDGYLLSAHMIQHLLLTLVGAPLLLMGTPGWMVRPLLSRRWSARLLKVFTHPIVALCLFNATFMVWHLPALYEAALEDEVIHVVQHLMFISTAVLAWWPVLSPLPELPRLSYPLQILYLFLQMLPTTVLGTLITFAPVPLYHMYVEAPRIFGISVMTDQELAGLIMWMPGGMIYLLALSIIFLKWVGEDEQPYNGAIV